MRVALLDDYQQVARQMADWPSLGADVEVVAFKDHWADAETVRSKLAGFAVAVAMRERTPFPRRLLEGLPDLRLLVTTGMRNASIDLAAATELGITVCGTRGGGPATAELAWGLILALARSIPFESAALRAGGWQTTVGVELQGKVLGLLGLGNLGSHMARIGGAFGMRVIAWSQHLTSDRAAALGATLAAKEELFARSDVLSIHLQLSERTRGIVGAHELGLMKPTAYFVNTSRGPIVDEAALLNVLRSRRIAGAGLDVYDVEPLPPDHPLRRLDNVVLTPHLGYVTAETLRIFYADALEDIRSVIAGQPVRVLNPAIPGGARGPSR